jgi:hypothetical protein
VREKERERERGKQIEKSKQSESERERERERERENEKEIKRKRMKENEGVKQLLGNESTRPIFFPPIFFSFLHIFVLFTIIPYIRNRMAAFSHRVARWHIFKLKIQIQCKFWRVLQCNVMVYFMAIGNILWPFDIFYGYLVYFSRCGML